MTRYTKILLVIITTVIFLFIGCDSSPVESNSDILYAKTSKNSYSLYDTVTLNIYNNTDDSVYFKYYKNTFITICEKESEDKWIQTNLIIILYGDTLNTQILRPDCIKKYYKRVDWIGKSRIRIPYNIDGSANFTDTLISNVFTVIED